MLKVLLFITIILMCGPVVAEETARPFLIVGEEYPPYEYLDESGRPAGINIEIIDRVFSGLNIPYEIKFYPWSRAWLMVVNGAADAVLSVSYQDERIPYLYFTPEQMQFWRSGQVPRDFLWLTEYVFFIHKRNADHFRFNSYEQLKADGYRVVINDQYSYDAAFTRAQFSPVVKNTSSDAFQALIRGEADLYPMDRTVGWALLQQKDLRDEITWLPKPLFMKPYLLGFCRKSEYPDMENLMHRFYAGLHSLRSSGVIEEITAGHLDKFRPQRSDRPVLFVCEQWRPFEYMENDEVRGLNPKVIKRIMNFLRIPYEIKIYPWPRAWMMAEKGRADAVISVSYKDTREDVLYYTDSQRNAAAEDALPHDYLWISRYVFFVKTKNERHLRFQSYDQIIEDGYRVGLNQGYSYCPGFPSDKFSSRTYFDTESGFLGLIKEEIDIYPMDIAVGLNTLKELGLEDSVTYLLPQIFSKPYLIPFVKRSDYPGLESIMYEFYHQLRQLRATGDLPY